jgi:hypothetical protein
VQALNTPPSPAIVSRSSARRLPRVVIFLLCLAYVLPGFFGRNPWKSADVSALGVMRDLATSGFDWVQWLTPNTETGALLPYWLGALGIRCLPFLDQATAARLPFVLLLALTLSACWHACYHLARQPSAQPVSFAFGGEAEPRDYAHAMADAALLALMSCLGLAQLTHETTATLAQLCMGAVLLYAASHVLRLVQFNTTAITTSRALLRSLGVWTLAQAALVLCGAPVLAFLFGLLLCTLLCTRSNGRLGLLMGILIGLLTLAGVALASGLKLWVWRISPDWFVLDAWQSSGQLLLWFVWPLWPFALWTLWRWRAQLRSPMAHPHLVLPLGFALIVIAAALSTHTADRSLLLALPALACLAAFALPTLKRSLAALVDWFSLLFFSLAGLCIWVIWLAMQTGFPPQPAANVARLAPGFEPAVSVFSLLLALAASGAWLWLVKWRVGRHRPAIWSSLVLPSGGAVLCWVLLMSLWLPLLDYARSYAPLADKLRTSLQGSRCVHTAGLSVAQRAGLAYHLQQVQFDDGDALNESLTSKPQCEFWLMDAEASVTKQQGLAIKKWWPVRRLKRFADKEESVLLYQRQIGATAMPLAAAPTSH